MRKQFVPNPAAAQPGEDAAQTEEQVYELCPWASEVIACEGGWQVFESAPDAQTWARQT